MAKFLAVPALVLGLAQPAEAEGIAGPYLAARQAGLNADYKVAARYHAMVLARGPSNPAFLEDALATYVSLGDFDAAHSVAREMLRHGLKSRIADTVILSRHFASGDFGAVFEDFDNGLSAGQPADSLIRAWALAGLGRKPEAAAAFDAVAANPDARNVALLHKAYALALSGDFEGADIILSGTAHGPLSMTRASATAHAQVLSQLGRNADALQLFGQVFGTDPDPTAARLGRTLAAGEHAPFTVIGDAGDGVAELFFSAVRAMESDTPASHRLIYARIAEYLRPDSAEILLFSASLLEELGQFGLAIETYENVPGSDPLFHIAELGSAEALRAAGDSGAGIGTLRRLAETHGDLPVVHNALGDMLRREKYFADAIKAYDRAVGLYARSGQPPWTTYYMRGIVHERTGNWELAEADFRQALSLNPSQPFVLNYLGYSLVERREKLHEALIMIENAVAAEPDNGLIADSLGWALYRLGRYKEATKHMERAAELEPLDPVISDHLGDTLWAVGRRREAEFQWRRALSFISDEDTDADPVRIRRKLEVGLDRVLEEEGAEPHQAADGL